MKPKELPPIGVLKEHFDYNPETGELRWKKPTAPRIKVGALAGTTTTGGYTCVKFKGKFIATHRIAWAMHYGEDPYPHIVDHKEGVEKGNGISNLRLATSSENNYNKRLHSNNTSGHRGVSYNKNHKKWCALGTIGGKLKTLGEFESVEEAVACRQKFEQDNNILIWDR